MMTSSSCRNNLYMSTVWFNAAFHAIDIPCSGELCNPLNVLVSCRLCDLAADKKGKPTGYWAPISLSFPLIFLSISIPSLFLSSSLPLLPLDSTQSLGSSSCGQPTSTNISSLLGFSGHRGRDGHEPYTLASSKPLLFFFL